MFLVRRQTCIKGRLKKKTVCKYCAAHMSLLKSLQAVDVHTAVYNMAAQVKNTFLRIFKQLNIKTVTNILSLAKYDIFLSELPNPKGTG